MRHDPSRRSFEAWRARVAAIAGRRGQSLDGRDDDLAAGFSVGDTPDEFVAGALAPNGEDPPSDS